MAHPRRYDESNKLIIRLRRTCLAFPAVVEKEAWGECTFRVAGGKMFAVKTVTITIADTSRGVGNCSAQSPGDSYPFDA